MASQSPSPPQSQRNILILGASYAGLSCAHYLLKHTIPKLPDPSSYRIVLASTSAHVLCRPACPRALISDDFFPQEKLFVEIAPLFASYPERSLKFVQGTATGMDEVARTVTVTLVSGASASDGTAAAAKTESIPYHALLICTGASTLSPLLGLTQDSSHLRSSWTRFRAALPSAKSIVIAGGGPAGIETAGELGEYLNGQPSFLNSLSTWFGSASQRAAPKVEITVVHGGERILPALRPALAEKAESYLAPLGVTILKSTRVAKVEPPDAGLDEPNLAGPAKVTLDNGKVLQANLYIPATGTQPNTDFVPKAWLAEDGRVRVNGETLRVEGAGAGQRVYALGDASDAPRPAVHLTLDAVPVLCTNIKRDLLVASAGAETTSESLKGVGDDRLFAPDTREAQLVPIGRRKGVGAVMGWRLPSWVVWAIKGRDYWLWTTGGLWSGGHWKKES